jgi:hypothetical protein
MACRHATEQSGDFSRSKSGVEDGEFVKVADVGGAEPELRRISLPPEREIPVFNFALKLVIDIDATGGPGRHVVEVLTGENDVRPGLA